MKNQQNDSTLKIIVGLLAIAIIAIGIYLIKNQNRADQYSTPQSGPLFTADETKEIEEIVVKVAREQTDIFMKAINEGMQLQQEKSAKELEKTAEAELSTIKKNAIVWGDSKSALQIFAMIDPMCPHCHDFMRNAIAALNKTKDIAFTIVVAPILGQNSVAVSKVMLAAAKQSNEKSKVLMGKFSEKVNQLTREKLLEIVKESGIDETKFKEDEESSSIQKQLEDNVGIFEKLKIPGVPTVFAQNKDGTLFAIPPLKPEVYIKLAERIKAGEDISKPPANEPKEEEEVTDTKTDEVVAKDNNEKKPKKNK
jgi:protein-disulfide isomerase